MNRLKHLFEEFKGMIINYGEFSGVVAGYSDSHFICATEQHPYYSFRRTEKDMDILEQYKDTKYRYFYTTETAILAQNKGG